MYVKPTLRLTHHATLTMLNAAVSKAEVMEQPQCIVIVDASGELLGEIRMTGAKYLSRKSATAKARTAASTGGPTTAIPEQVHLKIAAATGGAVTGLGGGLPIYIDGHLVGGIGVGSGTADQDVDVGLAALHAIGASDQAT
jgi:glc operon protein GlcG